MLISKIYKKNSKTIYTQQGDNIIIFLLGRQTILIKLTFSTKENDILNSQNPEKKLPATSSLLPLSFLLCIVCCETLNKVFCSMEVVSRSTNSFKSTAIAAAPWHNAYLGFVKLRSRHQKDTFTTVCGHQFKGKHTILSGLFDYW